MLICFKNFLIIQKAFFFLRWLLIFKQCLWMMGYDNLSSDYGKSMSHQFIPLVHLFLLARTCIYPEWVVCCMMHIYIHLFVICFPFMSVILLKQFNCFYCLFSRLMDSVTTDLRNMNYLAKVHLSGDCCT